MSLIDLSQVLNRIQSQPGWQQRRQFLQILEQWPAIVGESVAQHARPLAIYQQILKVAVSSSVWSQNLTFERRRILAKLNPILPASGLPLLDIHFSPAKWQSIQQESNLPSSPPFTSELLQQHPSFITGATNRKAKTNSKVANPVHQNLPQNAVEAFNRWANLMKKHSLDLPHCPHCQSSTPPGELVRWKMCRICASRLFLS